MRASTLAVSTRPCFSPRNFNKTGPGDEANITCTCQILRCKKISIRQLTHAYAEKEIWRNLRYIIIIIIIIIKLENVLYGIVSEKRHIIKKCYKMALRLNCYNFRTVKAINFIFSALHTPPFLYGKGHFGVLNMLHASIATSDTPKGFKLAITFGRNTQIAPNSVCT